jgi:2-polyprenyl-6-methoxyphenol hydroxylase-like FAD-dependent oxidoreductase
MTPDVDVTIVGGGIGGLTLALALHDLGITSRVYEGTATIEPVGVGINILPHATKVLSELGLEAALAAVAVTTQESVFFNRFGQFIYGEPAGRFAGYPWPQFSIHRGDLQQVLIDAVTERLGNDAIVLGRRCTGFVPRATSVEVEFTDPEGNRVDPVAASIVVDCSGVRSKIRRQIHPQEREPRYSGVHMWRGVTTWEPFLTGASMVRAGWLATGKMVIYPIRNAVDGQGRQLVNWVAEIERRRVQERDWNRTGSIDDFIDHFEKWTFDWLDVPEMIRSAERILEYPMVDQDPLDRWTSGRVTLLGDAAHPMVPRGSNGAAQAILDACCLADELAQRPNDPRTALAAYEAERRPATSAVVEMNRTNPPDAILREVYERSNDLPFGNLEETITADELRAISDRYKVVAGYDHGTVR